LPPAGGAPHPGAALYTSATTCPEDPRGSDSPEHPRRAGAPGRPRGRPGPRPGHRSGCPHARLARLPPPRLPRRPRPRDRLPAGPGPGRRRPGGPGVGLVLPDPSVSRSHARLEVLESGRLRVVDLGSTNGTLVNDVPVSQGQAFDG